MINTVLFDMDGLLLDTEPLWGVSMLRVAEKHKIPITHKQFKETTGLRIYEVTDHWAIHYPWEGKSSKEVAEEILDDIIETSKQHGSVLKGVEAALILLRKHHYKIGLASSSPKHMIDALVDHFGITKYFDEITSADAVELGKPHPAVFLHCAVALGSKPNQCVVLEDSVNGMIAGKAARMKVIVVPDELHYDDPRFSLADAKLKSLEDFSLDMLKKS
ncbi:MAG: HAD-superfamily hydrolase, subfamily variant 3 [Flavipsychrobacter sp.]|nr:HAD-superfamily hydrolase, subfamily variant 3 [Flavipsychrobacter sp.]